MNEDIVICRCEEITLNEIERAIENGAVSLDEIKKCTRASMGPCQGRICSNLINKILRSKGINLKNSTPPHTRLPVRTVKISDLTGDSNE